MLLALTSSFQLEPAHRLAAQEASHAVEDVLVAEIARLLVEFRLEVLEALGHIEKVELKVRSHQNKVYWHVHPGLSRVRFARRLARHVGILNDFLRELQEHLGQELLIREPSHDRDQWVQRLVRDLLLCFHLLIVFNKQLLELNTFFTVLKLKVLQDGIELSRVISVIAYFFENIGLPELLILANERAVEPFKSVYCCQEFPHYRELDLNISVPQMAQILALPQTPLKEHHFNRRQLLHNIKLGAFQHTIVLSEKGS